MDNFKLKNNLKSLSFLKYENEKNLQFYFGSCGSRRRMSIYHLLIYIHMMKLHIFLENYCANEKLYHINNFYKYEII